MKKLTPKMLEVLKELAKPDAEAHYMRQWGSYASYYFLSTTMKRCTASIRGLRERNLVTMVRDNEYGDHRIVINEFGRGIIGGQP